MTYFLEFNIKIFQKDHSITPNLKEDRINTNLIKSHVIKNIGKNFQMKSKNREEEIGEINLDNFAIFQGLEI